MLRVGVDIGGTFTDLVAYDEDSGRLWKTKSRTVPEAPEEGVLRTLDLAEIDRRNLSYFMHGTTLVTNLMLTRQGAKVGLVTTRGFRDVVEVGRSYRNELYNLLWDKPPPFVPRFLVKEVTERVDFHGNILTPLDPDDAARAVQFLAEQGVEAIAVALFNSYANPEHEQLVAEIVGQVAPAICTSISSEVDPRIREYDRFSTTVLNAYAMPRTYGYIGRLDDALGVPVKYMHSGGGIVPSGEARKFPVALIASGPAAGVLAGKFIGGIAGQPNVILMDVGGTSCDVCVVRNGKPDVKDCVDVSWGVPARTQAIDVNSVGAGGGSIAWVDEGGTLRVGPQSAGADPGPACYAFGGEEPTATDANLVLGILNPDNFLGGSLTVNRDLSVAAIKPVADWFDVTVEEAALGIHRLLNANMAQAILTATVKKGIDPRDFTLLPFGGAGGQTAVEVAEEVGIPRILYPRNPSTFSAFGLLTADLKNTSARTVLMPLARLEPQELGRHLEELQRSASGFLAGEEAFIVSTEFEALLDVRYVGQSTEVPVPIALQGPFDREAIYADFERLHNVLYGTQLGDPAEIVNVRVTATGLVRPLTYQPADDGPEVEATPRGSRRVAFYRKPIPVYNRDDLAPGMILPPACLVDEVDSTLFIPKRCRTRVDRSMNLIIDVGTGG